MDSWHSSKEAGNFLMTTTTSTRRNPAALNELENLFNSVSRGRKPKKIGWRNEKFFFCWCSRNVNNFFYLLIAHFHMSWHDKGMAGIKNMSDFCFCFFSSRHHQQLLSLRQFFFCSLNSWEIDFLVTRENKHNGMSLGRKFPRLETLQTVKWVKIQCFSCSSWKDVHNSALKFPVSSASRQKQTAGIKASRAEIADNFGAFLLRLVRDNGRKATFLLLSWPRKITNVRTFLFDGKREREEEITQDNWRTCAEAHLHFLVAQCSRHLRARRKKAKTRSELP